MPTRPALEIWFEFASSYSYLSVARLEPLAEAAGIDVRCRPFLLGPIFAAQGWDTSPFVLYPAKGRYMWRDMERRATLYGLPFLRPERFPQNSLLAARIATVAAGEGWCLPFARAVYHAEYADGRDISEEPVIRDLLARIGQPADEVIARALSAENKLLLRRSTEEAEQRGVFGAPTFLVGTELFWGDDRLDDALAFAASI